MKYQFVTIEGCIGSGKTSLAQKLSEAFRARLILESFENNPFLPKFYENAERYAFPLELFFLAERFKQIKTTIDGDLFHSLTISDYLLIKSLLFAHITLSDDEKQLYQRLFHIINRNLPQPEIVIYLHNSISNLMLNIRKRGRSYEQEIQPEYLEKLQMAYLNFLKQADFISLIVDVSKIDFVSRESDFKKIKKLLDNDYPKGIHFIHL